MLPDFRFVIGATLAATVLGVAAFGLATAVRLSHEAKVGPHEALRSLAFDDRADWNQFSDPELARRFEDLPRQTEATAAMPVPEAVAAAEVPGPAVVTPAVEARAPDEPAASIPSDIANVVGSATVVEDMPASFAQEPVLESELAVANAPQPAAQEPAVTAAITTVPVEPRTAVAELGAPISVEIKDSEPAPVEQPPVVAERAASIAAVASNEVAAVEIEPTAAPSRPQLRIPEPKPRPKQALAKPAKPKVAQAKKPRPRTAAQRPAASQPAAPQPFDLFGSGFRQ
jgi:hypothetical protein